MWQKARDSEIAHAAVAAAAPSKGKGRGRGANKRRAQEQPDGQPTPKKNTRSNDDLVEQSNSAPAPAKGLLASAAEVEANPEGTPADEDSVPASPEPPSFINGIDSAALNKPSGKLTAREKSPPLPKNISDPDEYGFRIYNQKPSLREKGINSRLFAPRSFYFEDWEIGFRDTINDSTKGHTRAKRGKYLDTPNSNGFHFDHWCNGYDYSNTVPEDFDMEKVKKYGVHPKYGIMRSNRPVEAEEPAPIVMPGKPVVYIANPSGRVHHASRSYQKTTNHRRSEDTPWRQKIGASMRRFLKLDGIDPEQVSVRDYWPTEEEMRDGSLGTAIKELEFRPTISEETSEAGESIEVEEALPQDEPGFSSLSVLTYASAFLEAQETAKEPVKIAPPTPKIARYDAIRDVFTDSKPTPPPEPERIANSSLDLLAELSEVVTRTNDPAKVEDELLRVAAIVNAPIYAPAPVVVAAPAPVAESDLRSTITRGNEAPMVTPTQPPVELRYNHHEVPQGYMQPQTRGQHPMQPAGPVHTQMPEQMLYAPVHDHAVAPQPPVRPAEGHHYPPPPGPPPGISGPPPPGPQNHPIQDQGAYMPHGNYPIQDHRDARMSAGRPVDPVFGSRRTSIFAVENPSYGGNYWGQQGPPPGPPPPAGPPPGPAPPQHYQAQQQPPPPSSRIPFSHNASAEPLPPLRPPRGRTQSIHDESMVDPSLRTPVHNGIGGSYYPPGPPRSYHRGFGAGPEPQHPSLQPISTERMLPNPQQTAQGYMTSPHQGYAQTILSPSYPNPPSMAGQMAHGPSDPNQGPPNSIHRHRSTPSNSSDAGNNKYRKLQPAPVPPHRTWPSKPELKTIPYDHKETGSAAALPSSGPTQIRGWNVNQPRKRVKSDKHDRSEPMQDREESR